MENGDHILKLAVKKLTDKATVEELQQLEYLLKKSPDTVITLQLLFDEWETGELLLSDEYGYRLLANIWSRIRQAKSHQFDKLQSQHKIGTKNEN